MKKYWALPLALILLIVIGFVIWRHEITAVTATRERYTDVARLYPKEVKEIRKETSVEDLVALVKEANEKGQKLSIRGSGHSQGGHTYHENSVVLDMKEFDEILEIDKENKLIRVQSGATWQDIQSAIAPHGLAIKVMQSSYIFTVGGSLSANAHGRDLDTTTIVNIVRSFRLLLPTGEVVNVSRNENPELFKLVIGGYGLFGLILDVELALTEDEIYEKKTEHVDYQDFPRYFRQSVQANPKARMMLVRPSIDIQSEEFLKTLVVSVWNETDHEDASLYALEEEKNVLRDMFLFDLSRRFDWAKSLRWKVQDKLVESGGSEYVSRNNAMRPPLAPLAFLDYSPKSKTDILQEYYVPVSQFVPFMDTFRSIILEDEVNIVSSTIRYVKANDDVYLSHTPKEDAFAIIVMSNIGLNESDIKKAEKTAQRLVDASLKHGGTYYLTYQLFPRVTQMKTAYPTAEYVFKKKLELDPNEVFISNFYDRYAKGKELTYEEFK